MWQPDVLHGPTEPRKSASTACYQHSRSAGSPSTGFAFAICSVTAKEPERCHMWGLRVATPAGAVGDSSSVCNCGI